MGRVRQHARAEEVVRLRDVERWSFPEIAEHLGIGVPACWRIYNDELDRRVLVSVRAAQEARASRARASAGASVARATPVQGHQ